MQQLEQQFIKLCLANKALKFGSFTLKSGRISPYFFNAGQFCSGQALAQLGKFLAERVYKSGLAFDMVFGPAYKGIPLVTSMAISLAEEYRRDVAYCFNRKQVKTYGDGGHLVGAPLKGRVLIADDVITAGTAIRESIDLINAQGAEVAGVVVLLDRQEKGIDSPLSAVQEVEKNFGIPVLSVIGLKEIMQFVTEDDSLLAYREQIQRYQQVYGLEGMQ